MQVDYKHIKTHVFQWPNDNIADFMRLPQAPLVELEIEGLWIYEVTRNMSLYQCIKLF